MFYNGGVSRKIPVRANKDRALGASPQEISVGANSYAQRITSGNALQCLSNSKDNYVIPLSTLSSDLEEKWETRFLTS